MKISCNLTLVVFYSTNAAEAFGVSPQAISRWENNSTYPDITMLPSIANYYNVSIDEWMNLFT